VLGLAEHFTGKHGKLVAPGILGLEQGGIGILDQLADRMPRLRVVGDADTGRYEEPVVVDGKALDPGI
jgi:hypothetical protein